MIKCTTTFRPDPTFRGPVAHAPQVSYCLTHLRYGKCSGAMTRHEAAGIRITNVRRAVSRWLSHIGAFLLGGATWPLR